jgi:hypothetical protein
VDITGVAGLSNGWIDMSLAYVCMYVGKCLIHFMLGVDLESDSSSGIGK